LSIINQDKACIGKIMGDINSLIYFSTYMFFSLHYERTFIIFVKIISHENFNLDQTAPGITIVTII
jgi:hypothetical protein